MRAMHVVAVELLGAVMGAAAVAEPQALMEPCLDYGRSFVNTKANSNSPRFWVESRCRISDPATGRTVEYLQCGSCKSEDTFAESDLFLRDNYDFMPVFSEDSCLIFRRKAQCVGRYRDVRPLAELWGGTTPCLRTFQGRLLGDAEEIFEAMDRGLLMLGQTELKDEATGRIAILEYPIKTLNWHREDRIWQVDTGPVVLPDLSVPMEEMAEHIQLAYIAFNAPDWSDFVVEQPTGIKNEDGEEVAQVYHYSGLVHLKCRNVLLALDE